MIEARNLVKVYKLGEVEIPALRGVSLNVTEGELISVIGPSGSGKSTLMHILGCLDTPTSGEYFLEGVDVSKMNDYELSRVRNEKIGFVFQTFNLLPHLTVLENVLLPVQYNPNGDVKNATRRAYELLEKFGLKHRTKNRPTQLSGGEMQRVAIARALINNPKILFADEPTGNLDSKTGLEILKILKELHKEGMTEIIVTHDLNITKFTERIIKIKDGLIEGEEINRIVYDVDEEGI
ncbi:MAG: ABC transporter ATP-binding protein [Caldisericum sp.]|nr:ABC transporter ATP-binding protein [Caldisericum sp.]